MIVLPSESEVNRIRICPDSVAIPMIESLELNETSGET